MSSALRNPAIRWVVGVYGVDSLVEWLVSIALMALVYGQTGSTAVAAGLLLASRLVPALLSALAGERLDELPAKTTLVAAFGVQALAVFAAANVGGVWVLFPLSVAIGTSAALGRAVLRASVAIESDADAFRGGSAALNVVRTLTALGGPLLAGVAVATVGASVTLDAAAVLALGLALTSLRAGVLAAPAPTASEPAATSSADGARAHQAAGLSVHLMFALAGFVVIAFSMAEPTLMAYSDRELGAGIAGYGWLFTAWGAGAVLGSAAYVRVLDRPLLKVWSVAVALCAVGYVGLAIAPTLLVACVFALIGGFGNGIDWAAISTAIQESAPKGQEMRIAARLETLITAAPAIGIAFGGVLAEFVALRTTLLLPGLICLALAVAVGLTAYLRDALARAQSAPSPSLLNPIHGGIR